MVDQPGDTDVGEMFARALASKDWTTLRSLLHDDLDFRGLTPRSVWQATADDLIPDVFRANWFEDDEVIEELVECAIRPVGTCFSLRYLLKVLYKEGPHLMEQQAYYRTEGGRIKWLRIMCSGAMPLEHMK